MEKSFIIQMDLDEAKITSNETKTYEGIVTRERAEFLMGHLNKKIIDDMDNDREINTGATFLDFLNTEELSGNDVAFLMLMGYSAPANIAAIKANIVASL